MKHIKKLLLTASALCALLVAITGCDQVAKNGGGFIDTKPENPLYKVVEIDGAKYIAYQTAWGYWEYTAKAEACSN